MLLSGREAARAEFLRHFRERLAAHQTSEYLLELAHEACGIGIACHGVAPVRNALLTGKELQCPDARVVMVSSVGYQENIVAALQKGARHFVQKPVKPEVLYEVIKYVLGEDAVSAAAPAVAGGSQ